MNDIACCHKWSGNRQSAETRCMAKEGMYVFFARFYIPRTANVTSLGVCLDGTSSRVVQIYLLLRHAVVMGDQPLFFQKRLLRVKWKWNACMSDSTAFYPDYLWLKQFGYVMPACVTRLALCSHTAPLRYKTLLLSLPQAVIVRYIH